MTRTIVRGVFWLIIGALLVLVTGAPVFLLGASPS